MTFQLKLSLSTFFIVNTLIRKHWQMVNKEVCERISATRNTNDHWEKYLDKYNDDHASGNDKYTSENNEYASWNYEYKPLGMMNTPPRIMNTPPGVMNMTL